MKISIPKEQLCMPWVNQLVKLLEEQAKTINEQAKVINEQAKVIQRQTEEIATLCVTIQELKDALAKLKRTPKRPKFRPGGAPPDKEKKPPLPNNTNLTEADIANMVEKVKEEIVIKPEIIPVGSRFKGYSYYCVEELLLTPKEITYKLEIWQAPDGSIIRARVPKEIEGSHYGPDLRAMIHGLYANGMTQPAIFQFVNSLGIAISEGQIHLILMGEAKGYYEQSKAILAIGLKEASYIRVDDTGAKHCHKSGYCTHIGGQYFAYYITTFSKSRANFLKILAQGKEGYIINEAFIWHLFSGGIKDDILNVFEMYRGKKYDSKKGLTRLLNTLEINNKTIRELCIEAGLIGFIQETMLKPGQLLLSDRAGQFSILNHAGCWVHMERPLRKLIASTTEVETEICQVREAIWTLYDQVGEASRSQKGKKEVMLAYNNLVAKEVISPCVKKVLENFKKFSEEMLKALDHPGLPLHNNDSERDIRSMVKFRNISGSTKSEEGRVFRDSLLTLKQTCFRTGINFWMYLRAWFRRQPINLAEHVQDCYQNVATG